MSTCIPCNGEGTTDDNEDKAERVPWSSWANLPVQSAAAIIFGLVKPTKCYACNGSGEAAK